MSREVRRVPLDWQHPKMIAARWDRTAGAVIDKEVYRPLFRDRADFPEYHREWEQEGDPNWPEPVLDRDYMPDFTGVPEDQMGWCMYEATSEGTPISPVFADPDELAHWLADNEAKSWGNTRTATYEQWKKTIDQGSAIGYVFAPGVGGMSGVEATTTLDRKEQP